MKTMKKFFIYALLIIGAYFVFSIFSYIFITNTYKNINDYEILETSPQVQILESKATYINGYIKGIVTNNTDALIDSEYIKFNFYNDKDAYLGSKYVEMQSFQVGKQLEFNLNYRFTSVKKYTVEFVEEEGIKHIKENDDRPFYYFLGLAGVIIILYSFF